MFTPRGHSMGMLILAQNSTLIQKGSASEKTVTSYRSQIQGCLWSRVTSKYFSGQEASVFPLKTMWALLESKGIRGTWRLSVLEKLLEGA